MTMADFLFITIATLITFVVVFAGSMLINWYFSR